MARIGENQAKHVESVFRHIVLTLAEGDNISTFAADAVNSWGLVQQRSDLRLKRGDRVTLVSADGLTMHDSCIVLKAVGGSVWLGKPLRIVSLESDVLFSDGVHEVVPVGTSFGVRHVRSGRVDGPTFGTSRAAEAEVLRRQPQRVA